MRSGLISCALGALLLLCGGSKARCGDHTTSPASFSGIYPHLAYWNQESECGTGAVVPWASRLWLITYGPHSPNGSSDKLYEIDSALRLSVRPESVGGTHANRMIHRESGQLFLGPYAISDEGRVRVIPPSQMPGRLTANARHLSDPAHRIYYATMEEGLYEVDVQTLKVTELYPDANSSGDRGGSLLPGYHGKGLYSGQGRLIYANNGERSDQARTDPETLSGCLAEWMGKEWRVVRRNQFTEVTGPGGLSGNSSPATDPLWSIGWDHRSLILMLLDDGKWHFYRLPKASHCYDGAHGWNTEWPRIRDIGEEALLMTMHGAFWKFPEGFSRTNSAGIAQRSTYLKVVGDFCRWQGHVILGCDDSARNEFLNKRKAKGSLAGPSISQSNLWWLPPEELDQLGAARGTGAVWLDDPVTATQPSEPYLFSGFERRAAFLAHNAAMTMTFTFEVDRHGTNQWQPLREVPVVAAGSCWMEFPPSETGTWVRVRTSQNCSQATALFAGSNSDRRSARSDTIFAGLATPDASGYSAGLLHAGGSESPVLRFAPTVFRDGKANPEGYYELDADMKLRRIGNEAGEEKRQELEHAAAIPAQVLSRDSASLLYIDDQGGRFTERDLFSAAGTFYELPAENAGGFSRIRPIATSAFLISDYCSWRGLLVLSGVADHAANGEHIIRSEDGRCALWLGAVDDLWKLGKAVGRGGPWRNSPVTPGEPSDPYLSNGFDRKTLTLTHDAPTTVGFSLEADFAGNGVWHEYRKLSAAPGQTLNYEFPEAFAAYWLRLTTDKACRATAELLYF